MAKILKQLLLVIAVVLIWSVNATSKKKEEIITPEKGYGYELASPAASMVLEYKSIREEFFFEEGQSTPSMRIIREFKSNGFQDDTLSYDAAGNIIRVGKFRDYEVDKRVELFDGHNSYHVKVILPTSSPYDKEKELRLTDFDSQGNWTKAYYRSDRKKPAVTRTIAYELTPEQKLMLAQNKATTAQDLEFDRALIKSLKTIGIILLVTGIVLCISAGFMKDFCGGQMRWIIWLICGIPIATFLFYYGDHLLQNATHWIRVVFRLGTLIIYMLLMRTAIITMSHDRRISNGFISTINVIWSIWAFFIICPPVMSVIMPNFFGRILSWVLGVILFMINYGYTASRCPRCRNPHGLEFDHRSLEGYRSESNTTTSLRRKNPEIVGLTESGYDLHAKVRTDTTHTTSTTTNTYEMVRDHYVCYECGYVESTGKMKGALIARNVSTSTAKGKEIHDVHAHID